jgi:hypothetical protein
VKINIPKGGSQKSTYSPLQRFETIQERTEFGQATPEPPNISTPKRASRSDKNIPHSPKTAWMKDWTATNGHLSTHYRATRCVTRCRRGHSDTKLGREMCGGQHVVLSKGTVFRETNIATHGRPMPLN